MQKVRVYLRMVQWGSALQELHLGDTERNGSATCKCRFWWTQVLLQQIQCIQRAWFFWYIEGSLVHVNTRFMCLKWNYPIHFLLRKRDIMKIRLKNELNRIKWYYQRFYQYNYCLWSTGCISLFQGSEPNTFIRLDLVYSSAITRSIVMALCNNNTMKLNQEIPLTCAQDLGNCSAVSLSDTYIDLLK